MSSSGVSSLPGSTVLHRRGLVGVAAISFAQLGFEVLFIKLSQYEFGSLSLGVVGLAMLGVSLSDPLARALGGGARATERAAASLQIAALLAGFVLFSLEHVHTGGAATAERLLGCGAACLTTIALSAVPVYVEMRQNPGSAHRVYAASLVGGALGPPCALAVAELSGDVGAYVVFVALASSAALLFVRPGPVRWFAAMVGVASVASAMVGLRAADRSAHPRSIYAETDAVSRIDVQRAPGGVLVFRTAGANAGTATVPVDPAARAAMRSALDVVPYAFTPARVLVLGSGAGRNVVAALEHGVSKVVAVEIDPMIPRYMRQALPERQDPYRDPRVSLVVGEGREVAARFAMTRKRGAPGFDLVYVPVATLFGSSGTLLTETYLMTREAVESYIETLNPGGIVAVYFPNVARAKIVRAVEEALVHRGIPQATGRMASYSDGGHFVVMARPDRPFTAEERATLDAIGAGEVVIDVASELARTAQSTPLEDDDPFLYADGAPRGKQAAFEYSPAFLGVVLLASSLGLALSLIAVVLGSGERLRALSFGTGFAVMGVAYTMVQTGFIQRLSFLLGHPVASAAVVLPCTLSATGFGSWASRGWLDRRYVARRLASAVAIVASVLGMAFIEPSWLVHPEWSWALRVVLTALIGGVPFAAMGTFFPAAFVRAERSVPRLLGRLWFVNGVAAVFGSLLVIRGGMLVGFRVTLAVAAGLYGLLAGWDVLSVRE